MISLILKDYRSSVRDLEDLSVRMESDGWECHRELVRMVVVFEVTWRRNKVCLIIGCGPERN